MHAFKAILASSGLTTRSRRCGCMRSLSFTRFFHDIAESPLVLSLSPNALGLPNENIPQTR